MSNPNTRQIRKTYAQHVSDYTGLNEATHAAEFDRWLKTIKAQAWQDGHDTALINGQSENPHDKENQ